MGGAELLKRDVGHHLRDYNPFERKDLSVAFTLFFFFTENSQRLSAISVKIVCTFVTKVPSDFERNKMKKQRELGSETFKKERKKKRNDTSINSQMRVSKSLE